MNETAAIKTDGLIKYYGNLQALYGVDLEVKRGEVFGFLGPNGAGKTTTIRCLLDTIHRNGGSVEVLGFDPKEDPVAVRKRTGYLPGELSLEGNMTGRKLIHYFNELRGKQANWSFIDQLAERLELDLRRPIKNLSHGNKQKIGVLQALMHRPEMLILDEPTTGLDPLMQQEVLKLICEAKEGGATVFFSSHIMSEVETVAERVGIIRRGKIVEVSRPEALKARALTRARVRFKESVDIDSLGKIEGVSVLSKDDSTGAYLQIAGEIDALIKGLAKYPVRDFHTERPSLEEVFLAYYGSNHA